MLSAGLSLLFGVAFIKLFQHQAPLMTKATVYSQVALPAAAALACLFAGQLGAAALLGGLAALTVWVFRLWREQIAIATRLLEVSAHGIAANPNIVTVTVLLNVASLLAVRGAGSTGVHGELGWVQLAGGAAVCREGLRLPVPPGCGTSRPLTHASPLACALPRPQVLPLGAFIAFAVTNGVPIPNPAREGRAECTDAAGEHVLCCSWQPDGFAQGYTGGAELGAARRL